MKIKKLKINISQVRLIQVLFVLTIFTIFSYIYMVNAITFDIAQKGKITNQISVINSEISDLELALIDKKKELSRDLAYEIGLTQEIENDTIYVVRGKNTRFTFNE
jgi:hypothetical protein